MWPKGENMSPAMVIGVEEGGLYRISGQAIHALVHEMMHPYKLWHKRFGHLNCNALPNLQKMVTGMPVFHFENDSVCKGCALGKNTKKVYPHSNKRDKDILRLNSFRCLWTHDCTFYEWLSLLCDFY